jgi:hypothetical protein
MRKRHALLTLCALASCVSLLACSWDRREPLFVTGVRVPLAAHSERAIVYFEEVVPHRPLPETIWDNAVGPSWNIEESRQIGFTQEYSVLPVILPPVAVAATSINTRLVVPFGRSVSAVFESALRKAYPAHVTCFEESCMQNAAAADPVATVLRIRFDAFYVWEGPVNHLNLYAKGSCRSLRDGGDTLSEYRFEKAALKRDLGGFFSTHAALIEAMNDVLNAFSEDLSVEIVTKGFGSLPARGPSSEN